MNELIKAAQRELQVWPDGVWGPQTHDAFLRRLFPLPHPAATADLPWVREMKAVYGWHEVRDNAKLRAWLKSDNKTLGDPAALPWCGDAVETAVKLALPDEPFVGPLASNPYWARNWAGFGREGHGLGCIGVFERGPTSGHVGFLMGEDDACYHVLGGNQGDTVNVIRRAKSSLLASRWPTTYGAEPRPLPRKPATLPVSLNEV